MFVDEESMERALRELNETMLDGRRIKLRKVCLLMELSVCGSRLLK